MRGRSKRTSRATTPARRAGTPRRAARRPLQAIESVRQGLQAYADRGIFRGFSERAATGGKHRFRFLYSTRRPIDLVYEPATGTLTFANLLPAVPARSNLDEGLRRFIEGRTSPALPPHRAIDPKRVTVACVRQRGHVSVRLRVGPGHEAYGVNRAVNLLHEIFVELNIAFPEYLWEQFGAPQE